MNGGFLRRIAPLTFALVCGCAHDYPVSLQPAYPVGLGRDSALAKVRPALRFTKGTFTDTRPDPAVLVSFKERAHSHTLRARRPLDETLFGAVGAMLKSSGHNWAELDPKAVRVDLQLLDIQSSAGVGLPGGAELLASSASSTLQAKVDFVNAGTGELIYSRRYSAKNDRGALTGIMGMLDKVTTTIDGAIVDLVNSVANDEQLASALRKSGG